MPIQTWFPTSIYVEPLLAPTARLRKFNRELLEQCYLVRDTDPDGVAWSETHYLNGYTSYGSMTDLHRRYPHFEELARAIDKHARKFVRALDMDLQDGSLSMSTCWVNIMPTNTVHSLHLHPLSVLSGTYYVDVPRGASSIKFEDPRLASMMAAPPKLAEARERNQQFVKLQPVAGHVLLWESWLRHEVPPNAADEDRVSVSFNYEWK
jgi:uncharacterized protein (TIGR02466 family)